MLLLNDVYGSPCYSKFLCEDFHSLTIRFATTIAKQCSHGEDLNIHLSGLVEKLTRKAHGHHIRVLAMDLGTRPKMANDFPVWFLLKNETLYHSNACGCFWFLKM